MDLVERLALEFPNVSFNEIAKIKDADDGTEARLRWTIQALHEGRELEKERGKFALTPGPLIHLISLNIQSNDVQGELTVYGEIVARYRHPAHGRMVEHNIYHRERRRAEILNASGTLTLNGPDHAAAVDLAFLPLYNSRLDMRLYDGADNMLVEESVSLDETEIEGYEEQAKSISVRFQRGSLTLRYIAIPLGINCRVAAIFCNRHNGKRIDHLNINGDITARFVNSYANYTSEECVLFKKHTGAFQRVEINALKMKLSRYWVALPAYASLDICFNLSDYDTDKKIVNDSVKLTIQPMMSTDLFILDDIVIEVRAAWFHPNALGRLRKSLSTSQGIKRRKISTEGTDEMDIDSEDEDETSGAVTSWAIRAHKKKLTSSLAVEFFSFVIIPRDKSRDVQIYGTIELLSGENICRIFRRDVSDAVSLTRIQSLILEGSRRYDYLDSLEIKLNVKDVDNQIVIKGLKEYHGMRLDRWCDQQLSYLVEGQNGFALVHYSIFPEAIAANVTISVIFKIELGYANNPAMIYGSIYSQLKEFDYSSWYNKNYYRVAVFDKIDPERAVPVNLDGSISLSRSMIIVPSYSSLIIDLDLSVRTLGLRVSGVKEIEIGDNSFKTIETNDVIVDINVDWCEIK